MKGEGRGRAMPWMGIFCLCLFVLHGQAQDTKVSTETDWGLHKVTFDRLEGQVIVTLPDDMAAGDRISGTVLAEPRGKEIKEREKNQSTLNGYVVEIKNQAVKSMNGILNWLVPATTAGKLVEMVLKDAKGKVVAIQTIPVAQPSPIQEPVTPDPLNPGVKTPTQPTSPVNQPTTPITTQPSTTQPTTPTTTQPTSLVNQPINPSSQPTATPSQPTTSGTQTSNFQIPDIIQSGKPIEIRGNFDGIYGTTKVTVGGQVQPLLAESPNKVVIEGRNDIVGPVEIVVTEGRNTTRGMSRILKLRIMAEKLQLKRNEATNGSVTVSGLSQDMKSTATIELKNESPSVVSLSGGNFQIITIPNTQITQAGEFTLPFGLTGIKPGNYDITTKTKPLNNCKCTAGVVQVLAVFSKDGKPFTQAIMSSSSANLEHLELPEGSIDVTFSLIGVPPCGNCTQAPCTPADIKIDPDKITITPTDGLSKDLSVTVTWTCESPNCGGVPCSAKPKLTYRLKGGENCDCGDISMTVTVTHAGTSGERGTTRASAAVTVPAFRLGGSDRTMIKPTGNLQIQDGDILKIEVSDVKAACWCKKSVCEYKKDEKEPLKVTFGDDSDSPDENDGMRTTAPPRGAATGIGIVYVRVETVKSRPGGLFQCFQVVVRGKCESADCKAKDNICNENMCIRLDSFFIR